MAGGRKARRRRFVYRQKQLRQSTEHGDSSNYWRLRGAVLYAWVGAAGRVRLAGRQLRRAPKQPFGCFIQQPVTDCTQLCVHHRFVERSKWLFMKS